MRRAEARKAAQFGALAALVLITAGIAWIVIHWSSIVAGTIRAAESFARAQALPWALGFYAFGPLFLVSQVIKTSKDGVRGKDGRFVPAFWALGVVAAIYFEVYVWNDRVLSATQDALMAFASGGMPNALATIVLGWPVALTASVAMILLSLQQNPARVYRSVRREFKE